MHVVAAVFVAAVALATQAEASDGAANNCGQQSDGLIYSHGNCEFADHLTHAQMLPLNPAIDIGFSPGPLDDHARGDEVAQNVADDQEEDSPSQSSRIQEKFNPAGCAPLGDWNRRAEAVDALEPFGAELLNAYGLPSSAADARRLMVLVYSCYVLFGNDPSHFEYLGLEAVLGDYPRLFSLQADPAEMIARWNNDAQILAMMVESLPADSGRIGFALTAGEAFLQRWNVMPTEVRTGEPYRTLEATVRNKKEEVAGKRLASADAQDKQNLEALIAAGFAGHSNQISELGLADDFLDSVIILEAGRNRPWITLRSWVAALYGSQAFDLIEGREIPGTETYGIITKMPAQRPTVWLFNQQAGELFLAYTGEQDRLFRIPNNSKPIYALKMQDMVR